MATLHAKTTIYPGSYGLNTQEAIITDETARFGAVVTNGVVDSAGKLTSRKDFVRQTTGFSQTVGALFTHRNADATETIFSAAAGQLYSGTTTLTSRLDYRAGSQVVDVGGAKTGASTTGLANSAETYGMTVAINGGAAGQVTVTGSAAQTYTNLLTEINADLTGASASIVGGNLRIISASNGVNSAISIANVAGTASNVLLSTLSNFIAVRVASAGTATAVDWQFASLNTRLFAAQTGRYFTCLNEATFAEVSIVGQPWSNAVNCVMAAYGRVWAANDSGGGVRDTVWWSNLLDGTAWNSGDAGSLNLTNAWPAGEDSIVAIAAAFNNAVIFFGRRSILVYTLTSTNNPAAMTLTDTITDLGCVARDSVVVTDSGVYFLSDNGIYRIEKPTQTTALIAAPQVSALYNDLVLAQITAETAANIRGGYYPTEGWYVLSFPTSNVTFCVHTRKKVTDANLPIGTRWTNTGRPFYAFAFDRSGNWYSGGVNGVHLYSGYTPDGTSNNYNLVWTGQWDPFKDESRLKHLKSATLVVETDSLQTGTFEWNVDYLAGTTRSNAFTASAVEFAEAPGVGKITMQLGGSFQVIRPSVSFPINGDQVTLHELRLYATPGAVKL